MGVVEDRSPSTWSLGTVMIACCSLDTLSLEELEAIRDDFVLEGCQSCTADFPPAMHLQVLRQNIKVRSSTGTLSFLFVVELENAVRWQ